MSRDNDGMSVPPQSSCLLSELKERMRAQHSPVRPHFRFSPGSWLLAVVTGAACVVAGGALLAAGARGGEAQTVQFDRQILPILSENCFTCHGPDAKARKADLRLDLKETALRKTEPVIVPGQSALSVLIDRVTSKDIDEKMPPNGSGKKLTVDQVELLKKWIDQGATWSKHWAFEPVRSIGL
jgi:hypothetical protein